MGVGVELKQAAGLAWKDLGNFGTNIKENHKQIPTVVVKGAAIDPKGAGDFWSMVVDFTGLSFAKPVCSVFSKTGQALATAAKCIKCGEDAAEKVRFLFKDYESFSTEVSNKSYWGKAKAISIKWIKGSKNQEIYLKAGKEAIKFVAVFYCPKSKVCKAVKVVFSLGVDTVLQLKQDSFFRLMFEGRVLRVYNNRPSGFDHVDPSGSRRSSFDERGAPAGVFSSSSQYEHDPDFNLRGSPMYPSSSQVRSVQRSAPVPSSSRYAGGSGFNSRSSSSYASSPQARSRRPVSASSTTGVEPSFADSILDGEKYVAGPAAVFKSFAYGASFLGNAFALTGLVVDLGNKKLGARFAKIARVFGKTKGTTLYLLSFNQGLKRAEIEKYVKEHNLLDASIVRIKKSLKKAETPEALDALLEEVRRYKAAEVQNLAGGRY